MERKRSEIIDVYKSVWAFREQYSQYWTTPTPIESARYAFMEMGEVLDAEMRQANPHHNRRAVKEINLAEELADVVIMSCSVLPGEYASAISDLDDFQDNGGKVRTLDELAILVARLFDAAIRVRDEDELTPTTEVFEEVGKVILKVMLSIDLILEDLKAPDLKSVVAGKLLVIYKKRISALLT